MNGQDAQYGLPGQPHSVAEEDRHHRSWHRYLQQHDITDTFNNIHYVTAFSALTLLVSQPPILSKIGNE